MHVIAYICDLWKHDFFVAHDNGVLDIELYKTTEARRPIYNDLMKKNFIKRFILGGHCE